MITKPKKDHTVIMTIKNTDTLSEAQINEIKNAKSKQKVYDDDCPSYSYEQLSNMLEKTKGRVTPIQARIK